LNAAKRLEHERTMAREGLDLLYCTSNTAETELI
jgi:hypothetical protein